MAPAAQVKAASALESLTTLLDVGGWVARGMGSVGGRSADTSGAQNKFAASRGGGGGKTLALYWQEPGKNERPLSVMLSRKLGRKRQWDKEG